MKIQKVLILSYLFFFLSPFICYGEDIYVAQTATGSSTGVSCSNSRSIAWFNTIANWGSGAGKISAGDTVHLCGTITDSAVIQASGSAGNVITLLFESGAKFSKSAWGTASKSAIYGIRINYVTIDGNNVGIIENTDNGTGLGAIQESYGITINAGSNWTIKNLTIKELYKRKPRGAGDSASYGKGIYSSNTSNLTISNNTIYGMYYCMALTATSGNPSGLNIHHNDLSQMSTGVVVRLDGATNYSNVNIYNNRIYDSYVWDGCWGGTGVDQCMGGNWHHRDGIHTWGNYNGNTLGPINIYNNEFSGDWGTSSHVTGYIYLTDYTSPTAIYNNVMVATVAPPSNGFIALHTYSTSSASIYNNTIVSTSSSNTGGTAIYLTGSGMWTADIRNNIISTLYIGIYDATYKNVIASDYNVFYNIGNVGRTSSWYSTLAQWRSALGGCPGSGKECNSMTKDPFLTVSYTIPYNSPAKDSGVNLSSIFNFDKTGFTRFSGYGWDIGAHEYNKPEPPRNLKIK